MVGIEPTVQKKRDVERDRKGLNDDEGKNANCLCVVNFRRRRIHHVELKAQYKYTSMFSSLPFVRMHLDSSINFLYTRGFILQWLTHVIQVSNEESIPQGPSTLASFLGLILSDIKTLTTIDTLIIPISVCGIDS